uniref:Transmembrane protein n=1 Tax=Nicotiana tabacum TaxID=4097 RepID=A0A1S4AEG8_TOBAC|nr:PREDICTED: uncharacterized protein LOC107796728 [Nicotiana tabacum]XP_033515030.1 uncharacterized protein LOC117279587 [Nicotiana tomentosiformis]
MQMGKTLNSRPLQSSIFLTLFSLFLQLIPGLADTSVASTENKVKSHSSRISTGVRVAIVLLGILAAVGFCYVLFKIWQKKKREEQQARLLKLFEEDDDLEVELGIQD